MEATTTFFIKPEDKMYVTFKGGISIGDNFTNEEWRRKDYHRERKFPGWVEKALARGNWVKVSEVSWEAGQNGGKYVAIRGREVTPHKEWFLMQSDYCVEESIPGGIIYRRVNRYEEKLSHEREVAWTGRKKDETLQEISFKWEDFEEFKRNNPLPKRLENKMRDPENDEIYDHLKDGYVRRGGSYHFITEIMDHEYRKSVNWEAGRIDFSIVDKNFKCGSLERMPEKDIKIIKETLLEEFIEKGSYREESEDGRRMDTVFTEVRKGKFEITLENGEVQVWTKSI